MHLLNRLAMGASIYALLLNPLHAAVGTLPAGGEAVTGTFDLGIWEKFRSIDVRVEGAKCDGTTDDSAAFVAARNALPTGGNILVPSTGHACVIATGFTLGDATHSGVNLRGTGGAYWPGYNDNIESHWTAFGSWIKCTDTVNSCITVGGNGSTIDNINFWYTQPTPSGSTCGATCTFTHTWTPTTYPYTISILAPQNFNHFSNINIINATNCIDIEGPSTGVASFYTYFDHLQLGCFNVGMKMNRVDNAISGHDIKFLMLWYQAYANVWGYMEGDTGAPGHKVDMDMSYVSDAAFSDTQFYQSAIAIRIATGTVTSGLGAVTFGAQGLQFTNTVFNQVCNAITLSTSGGANPIVNGDFTNTVINIDPQTSTVANQCGQATPIAFNLNSNNVDLSFTNINGFLAQQLFEVGNGISGGVHLSGRNRISYSSYAAGAPAIHVATGGFVDMASGLNNFFPANGSAGAQCTGSCRNWPSVSVADHWLAGPAGVARQQLFMNETAAGVFQSRWGLITNSVAESGANAGSNFEFQRYSDTGAYIDSPISINRATGLPYFPNGIQLVAPVACAGKPTGTLWNNAGVAAFCP